MADVEDSSASSAPSSSSLTHDARSDKLHGMAKKIARHFPTVPVTNSTALRRSLEDPLLKQSIVVVDVRTPEEVAVSRIPSSLTKNEFEAQKDELRGKTVVCYCTIGYRSSSYAASLKGQGIEAKNLEGGIVRWAQKRYPLVATTGSNGGTAEQETKRVHVYGKEWALQPDDYEAVMFKRPVLVMVRSLLPSWLGGR